ncbi:histidine triad nucleotide-binding protein [Thermorudis peleae]|mgnify:CR=1 FL=1|uniref:histidine triad nucleotide-binding protein n=1 Tax=Thermorudis peleae TaxID=1382356 RepID=UPI00056EDFF6|nr:histidine triad nucleotide-binding protein [Thermorudis peleae]MBX6752770.1 histidine triad nucleotide-binding protein [Thermorudis peleae]
MTEQSCIFCAIAAGQQPATVVYRDDRVTAFWDIRPQAKVHVLIIPNQHFSSLDDAINADPALLGHCLQVAARLAREQGIHTTGYRVVTNVGPHSGQSVFHLHFHLLGGNPLRLALG